MCAPSLKSMNKLVCLHTTSWSTHTSLSSDSKYTAAASCNGLPTPYLVVYIPQPHDAVLWLCDVMLNRHRLLCEILSALTTPEEVLDVIANRKQYFLWLCFFVILWTDTKLDKIILPAVLNACFEDAEGGCVTKTPTGMHVTAMHWETSANIKLFTFIVLNNVRHDVK